MESRRRKLFDHDDNKNNNNDDDITHRMKLTKHQHSHPQQRRHHHSERDSKGHDDEIKDDKKSIVYNNIYTLYIHYMNQRRFFLSCCHDTNDTKSPRFCTIHFQILQDLEKEENGTNNSSNNDDNHNQINHHKNKHSDDNDDEKEGCVEKGNKMTTPWDMIQLFITKRHDIIRMKVEVLHWKSILCMTLLTMMKVKADNDDHELIVIDDDDHDDDDFDDDDDAANHNIMYTDKNAGAVASVVKKEVAMSPQRRDGNETTTNMSLNDNDDADDDVMLHPCYHYDHDYYRKNMNHLLYQMYYEKYSNIRDDFDKNHMIRYHIKELYHIIQQHVTSNEQQYHDVRKNILQQQQEKLQFAVARCTNTSNPSLGLHRSLQQQQHDRNTTNDEVSSSSSLLYKLQYKIQLYNQLLQDINDIIED